MAIAYRCTNKHRWEVTKSVDEALSHLPIVSCPTCQAPMQRGAASKYNNTIVKLDGYRFQSQHEANEYERLKQRQRAGLIRNLRVHTSYPLVVNGVRVGKYTDDFSYQDCQTGEVVVVDTKARITRTEAYGIRKKLMLAVHGIVITEVLNEYVEVAS